MYNRYIVYDGTRRFPSVVAPSPQEAVRKACVAVPAHDPSNCTAAKVEMRPARWSSSEESVDRGE